MLREVKNKHVKPRIIPFQIGFTATTVDIGYGDFTLTKATTGVGTLTSRHGFNRNGLLFAVNQNQTAGYAPLNSATASPFSFPITTLNSSGTAVDGAADGFVFGWDSSDLSISKQQRVACTQASPRIIWGKITGSSGAVAINAKDFSCTRTAAGNFTVTFNKAFGKIPVVMVTCVGNTSTSVASAPRLASKTADGCNIRVADEGAGDADTDFYIMAIGSDSRSDSARGRMPLQNSQRKPRIIAGQITMASGVPSISIGGATGGADFNTLVDIGAGNFSIKIAESFIREPAIFLSTTTQRAEVKSYTAGVIDIKTKAANGNDTDVDGVTNIFIIGTDVNETF